MTYGWRTICKWLDLKGKSLIIISHISQLFKMWSQVFSLLNHSLKKSFLLSQELIRSH